MVKYNNKSDQHLSDLFDQVLSDIFAQILSLNSGHNTNQKVEGLGSKWTVYEGKTGRSKRLKLDGHISTVIWSINHVINI